MFHFPLPNRPPIRRNMPTFVFGEGVYTIDEIDRINKIADAQPAKQVLVGNDTQAQRKLSITFQMSDPSDYEGGDLEFNGTGRIETAPKKKGQLILFPSYCLHRVAPVTKGVRRAMVAWIVGPPFR